MTTDQARAMTPTELAARQRAHTEAHKIRAGQVPDHGVHRMTPLPTSVKVGFRVYQIVELSQRYAVARNISGECSINENRIGIEPSQGAVKAANTLLHEILHALWSMWNMDAEDGEERTVHTFADGLATVWVDNPQVFRWLDEALRSGEH